jgi:hypothetical protein
VLGFYGSMKNEVASSEEVKGFKWTLGIGTGSCGGTVGGGLNVSAPMLMFPINR